VSSVKRELLLLKRKQREEKRQAEWAARRAKQEAALQAERDANCGWTVYEITEAVRDAEEFARNSTNRNANVWLVTVLKGIGYGSEFVDSMIESLERKPISQLSDRQRQILCDIYAKESTGGARRNSKAYDAAVEEFESKSA
jgi:hypothetical protein